MRDDDLSPDSGDAPPPSAVERAEGVGALYLDYLRARRELLDTGPEARRALDDELRLIEVMHGLATDLPRDTAAPAPPPSADLPQGERVGRYVLREFLGRGSSAEVHRAYDPATRRDVALKIFHGDNPAFPDATERFRRDARIGAHLNHSNIVAVYEAGEDGDRRYIAMGLVRGETLEQRLAREPRLTFGESAALVRKLAAALDYAHTQGVVHRDVKPSNILLDEAGEPRLADFGLARHSGGDGTLTEAGQVLGTPAYMSPEQAGGNARTADGRSDVYSLGVVLYRLLTGRLPFPDAKSFTDHLYHVVHTDPPTPRRVNPEVPLPLETICLKAMAKDVADRFATAGAFAEQLRRWLGDEPTIEPDGLTTRAARWYRHNRTLGRVIAAAAILVIVASGVALEANRRATEEGRLRNLEIQLSAVVEVERLVEQARSLVRRPQQGRRLEAQRVLLEIGPYRRLLPESELERLDLAVRSTFVETLCVPDVSLETAKSTLPLVYYQVWPVALHPKGQILVVGTHRGPLRWAVSEKFEPTGLDPTKPRPRLAYSPGGRYLAFAPGDGGLELYDGDTCRRLAELEPAVAAGHNPSRTLAFGFGPSEEMLWACRADGRVQSWALAGLNRLADFTVPAPKGGLTAAAFGSGGRLVAVGDGTGRVVALNAAGQVLEGWPLEVGVEVQALAWSPDGHMLAVGTKHGRVLVRRANGTVKYGPFNAFPLGVDNLVFSPDGRWLFGGQRGEWARVWDAQSGALVLICPDAEVPFAVSADSQRLAAGSHARVKLLAFHPPTSFQTLRGHRFGVAVLAWSHDSRYLASADNSSEVRVWDVAESREIDEFQAPQGNLLAQHLALALNDDGSRVACVSSDDDRSQWLLRNPKTHEDRGSRPMAAGFGRLGHDGERFVLVREELDGAAQRADAAASWPVQTVVYEARGDDPPQKTGVLRSSEPGDLRRFLYAELTPDGRYYWWVGPREPSRVRRVEVYDLHARCRIVSRPLTNNEKQGEPGARISPDGRFLWFGWREDVSLLDLAGDRSVSRARMIPAAVSAHRRWSVAPYSTEAAPGLWQLPLRASADETVWLDLASEAGGRLEPIAFSSIAFSPDERQVAWGSKSGIITVADLDGLSEQISAFEKRLRED